MMFRQVYDLVFCKDDNGFKVRVLKTMALLSSRVDTGLLGKCRPGRLV